MILHANVRTVLPVKNVINVKTHAHQIHVNQVPNVADKATISSVFVQHIVKENDAIWIREMFAAVLHVKMAVHAEKAPMDRHFSVCADLAIAEINAKPFLIHADQTHAYTVANVLA